MRLIPLPASGLQGDGREPHAEIRRRLPKPSGAEAKGVFEIEREYIHRLMIYTDNDASPTRSFYTVYVIKSRAVEPPRRHTSRMNNATYFRAMRVDCAAIM